MTDEQVEEYFEQLSQLRNRPNKAQRHLEKIKKRHYGKTFSGRKTVEELTRIGYLFIQGRLDNAQHCCQCGACCDRVLMLTKSEQQGILSYLKEHPELKTRIETINEDIPHRKCPFLDHTREKEKCLIYGLNFFPVTCSTYLCNVKKTDPCQALKEYNGDIPEYVDMWHLIGDDVDISRAWQIKDQLEIRKIFLKPSIGMKVEKLNEGILQLSKIILNSLDL